MLRRVFSFLFTSKFREKWEGVGAFFNCRHCNETTRFDLYKRRKWAEFLSIPVFPLSRRRYAIACCVCGVLYEIPKEDVDHFENIGVFTAAHINDWITEGTYQTKLEKFYRTLQSDGSIYEVIDHETECPECGNRVSVEAIYCEFCGSELDHEEEIPVLSFEQ